MNIMNKVIEFGLKHAHKIAVTEIMIAIGICTAVGLNSISPYFTIAAGVLFADVAIAANRGIIR